MTASSTNQSFFEIIPGVIHPPLFRTEPKDFFDDRNLIKKAADAAFALLGELDYRARITYRKLFSTAEYHHPEQKINWNEESQGLAVLIHGLRGHPAIWDAQLALLKDHPAIDLFAPFVPKQGLCSLEEAAAPLLSTILDYTQKHPQKPICLMGVSNGSRIATWIETQLRERAPQSPVKTSTIAGVHLGSCRINQLGAAGQWLQPAVAKELAYESPTAVELLNKVKEPISDSVAERDHDFFATLDDFMVPNIDSSLPRLNKKETFYITSGVGHNAIVAAVAEQQISACVQWIQKYAPPSPTASAAQKRIITPASHMLTAALFDIALLPVALVLLAVAAVVRPAFDPLSPKTDKTPILLLHGSGFNETEWLMGRQFLKKEQYGSVFSLNYDGLASNDSAKGIDDYARGKVRDKILKIQQMTGQNKVILIGHSMGGLIAGYYAEHLAESDGISVDHIISVGSPWKGAPPLDWLARKPKRYIQMSVNSPFLKDLVEKTLLSEKTGKRKYYNIGSSSDFAVPASQSIATQEPSRQLMFSHLGHYGLIASPTMWHRICSWLDAASQPN